MSHQCNSVCAYVRVCACDEARLSTINHFNKSVKRNCRLTTWKDKKQIAKLLNFMVKYTAAPLWDLNGLWTAAPRSKTKANREVDIPLWNNIQERKIWLISEGKLA